METVVTKQELLGVNAEGPEVYYQMFDGDIRRWKVGKIFPMPEQDVLAEEFLRYLNAKVHMDGSWRLVWKEPKRSYYDKLAGMFRAHVPQTLEFEYLDADGDVLCTVFTDDPVWQILDHGITFYANQCYDAVMAGREFLKMVEVGKNQTYKRALGELPTDPNAEVPL